ncbi:MAG: UTP--glucose-1-phosphate uridylyltransferase GalU [Betaproteobacteria bacterium]|nr:UTP--glucose-1-phosphate uridylyltransferase GalU [Betaproteobacteria bacterium]
MIKVTKAVFPVAGMGTRFLPATKASPKEMLPVVDKPLIQYAVEEAVAAGLTQLIFITGRNKRAIEDHFDKAYELETELEARGRTALLAQVNIVPNHVSCTYIRQTEALGLGHAVLCARPVVGNEPFAVILADDLIDAGVPVLRQMVEAFEHECCSVVAVQEIDRHDTGSYGIIAGKPEGERIIRLERIVEKPKPQDAPSNLGVIGRYILTPAVFEELERVKPGVSGEIQLTDGIAAALAREGAVGYRFEGIRYDCGSKLGYLKANIMLGLRHPEIGEGLARFLKDKESNQDA